MLTAMSALSARTYSCGGEGARFFLGGGEVALPLQAPFLKSRSRLPWVGGDRISSSVSIDCAEESEDISEEDIMAGLWDCLGIDYARLNGADRW